MGGANALPVGMMLLGRFKVLKTLGSGAQASVVLTRDERLEREVAIKLLHLENGHLTQEQQEQWLREARHLSQLSHPHVVTLYQAEWFEGRPGLVMQYVPGDTLAQFLANNGPMSPVAAVGMMLAVLDALEAAHKAGLVHRDLKPANILLDAQGQPKVSDFGIASRSSVPGKVDSTGRVQGTPGYMSPQALQGMAPQALDDVFAAGLVLAEMVLGEPVFSAEDRLSANRSVLRQDVVLPAAAQTRMDDTLRALLMRAVARNVELRYDSAAAMKHALADWLRKQSAGDMSEGEADGKSHSLGMGAGGDATLEFLLRRMRHKSDFPAMSEQIVRVQNLASSENESLHRLTNEILKDVALTNKLLRLVNSAQYAHVAQDGISTVSRAVNLIGFGGIRDMAMSLMLLEHMQNKAHAQQLISEFLRGMLAGTLATDLTVDRRTKEEAFIGALFQNLGRMLAEFYFPEEAQQVRLAVASGKQEQLAARQILGLDYDALGQGVGKSWGLPTSMLRLMQRPAGKPPNKPSQDAAERGRWITLAANDLADAFLHTSEKDLSAKLREVAQTYGHVLGLQTSDVEEVARTGREKLAKVADALGLNVPARSQMARLIDRHQPATEVDTLSRFALNTGTLAAHQAAQQGGGVVSGGAGGPKVAAPDAPALAQPPVVNEQALAILANGIQDVTNAMVDTFALNDVMRMILEAMYRGMGFQRVLFGLRDANTDCLTGRFGLGHGATLASKAMRVPLKGADDLISALCVKGADTLIRDATAHNVASRLPAWYREHVAATAFLLLPMQLKGQTFALIYADKPAGETIELQEKELALLKTLRNQAVMAFRQARG
ncbi:MAG: hypothetical protein RI959_1834 [Pseudomonadota bacterium]